jgi:iron complex outermembrane receptor protein
METFATDTRKKLSIYSAARHRRNLLAYAVGALSLGIAAPQFAVAAPRLEEVIVTAQKRDESQQEVPVAMTNFTPEDLVNRGVVNISQVAQSTPSMQITQGTGQSNVPVISLRGQVQNDAVIALDPSVGIYLDDIYLARPYGAALDMFDMARIEVLKGPQGTLYGRNTTGGTLKLITNKAETSGGVTGYVKGGVGNYNYRLMEGAINLPLIEDVLAARISLQSRDRDGYVRTHLWDDVSVFPAGPAQPFRELGTYHSYDKDNSSARANIVWNVSDQLTLSAAGDYTESFSNGSGIHNYTGDIPVLNPATSALTGFTDGRGFYDTYTNHQGKDEFRNWGTSVTAEYEADLFAVKGVYGHRFVQTEYAFDVDATPMCQRRLKTDPLWA